MGKGSKWRETDYKKYYENWEKIKLSKNKVSEGVEVVKKKGKTTYKYK